MCALRGQTKRPFPDDHHHDDDDHDHDGDDRDHDHDGDDHDDLRSLYQFGGRWRLTIE